MKKAITIILALVMVLSLVACGGGNQTANTPAATETPATTSVVLDKNDVASYLGEWKSAGMSFTFNKGGIGRYDLNGGWYDFTYKVSDEVVVITILDDFVSSFELNDDGSKLTILQNGLPSWVDGETEFLKQ